MVQDGEQQQGKRVRAEAQRLVTEALSRTMENGDSDAARAMVTAMEAQLAPLVMADAWKQSRALALEIVGRTGPVFPEFQKMVEDAVGVSVPVDLNSALLGQAALRLAEQRLCASIVESAIAGSSACVELTRQLSEGDKKAAGKTFKRVRDALDVTREELAAQVGISVTSVFRAESGEWTDTPLWMELIAYSGETLHGFITLHEAISTGSGFGLGALMGRKFGSTSARLAYAEASRINEKARDDLTSGVVMLTKESWASDSLNPEAFLGSIIEAGLRAGIEKLPKEKAAPLLEKLKEKGAAKLLGELKAMTDAQTAEKLEKSAGLGAGKEEEKPKRKRT